MPILDYHPAPQSLRKRFSSPHVKLTALSVLLFLISLPLPACYVSSSVGPPEFYGVQLLMGGCCCGFLVYPCALTNPVLIAVWLLTLFKERFRILPILLAVAALVLSFSFLYHTSLMM